MEREFRDIKGFEGKYKISNDGEVLSLLQDPPRLLAKKPNAGGKYYMVGLSDDGIMIYALVHRLVGEAFIPNPNNLPQINHKDENGLNNNVDNLEWCDRSYNMNYGTRAHRQAAQVKKAVWQFEKDGTFIREWEGGCDAEEAYNKRTAQNISRCCRRKIKSAYGFVWRFKGDNF